MLRDSDCCGSFIAKPSVSSRNSCEPFNSPKVSNKQNETDQLLCFVPRPARAGIKSLIPIAIANSNIVSHFYPTQYNVCMLHVHCTVYVLTFRLYVRRPIIIRALPLIRTKIKINENSLDGQPVPCSICLKAYALFLLFFVLIDTDLLLPQLALNLVCKQCCHSFHWHSFEVIALILQQLQTLVTHSLQRNRPGITERASG